MSKQSAGRNAFVEHRLRDVRKGQVLKLGGSPFAVLAQERRKRLVQLDLKAEDGALTTLIGVRRARVRLRNGTETLPGDPSGCSEIKPVTDVPMGHVQPRTSDGAAVDEDPSRKNAGAVNVDCRTG